LSDLGLKIGAKNEVFFDQPIFHTQLPHRFVFTLVVTEKVVFRLLIPKVLFVVGASGF